MGTVVIYDGEVLSPDEARVSIFDHGFLFGDSVYDVVRTRHEAPFLLDEHLGRLRRSAAEIQLGLPYTDEELRSEVCRALALAGNGESYVRIIITRGVGELELHPGSCERPTLILIARPLVALPESLYQRGIRLAVVGRRRNDPQSLNPNAKTGNYLNNVLAAVEARRRGADDAIMLNAAGHLTEGTTSNLFFVQAGVVHNPALKAGILEGITRAQVIRMLGAKGIECREGFYTPKDLRAAEEVFITSTTRDVVPVYEVDEEVVGEGEAGPVARLLHARFARPPISDAR